jgi:hypothetical protein
MNAKAPKDITTPEAKNPDTCESSNLPLIGGSASNDWNNVLANQTLQTLWVALSDEQQFNRQRNAMIAALFAIRPKDELESMLAAQLIATHNAVMECHRHAMLGVQTFDGRRDSLNQASKLSRTYASLLETLNRHRGKGQQKVTVEHVHVHQGGQAIVGHVEHRGEGYAEKSGGSTPCKGD